MKIALVAPYAVYLDGFQIAEDSELDHTYRPFVTRGFSPSDALLQLAAFTPPDVEIVYMDDQYRTVDTNAEVDIAAISVLTISADRAYELAGEFRKRGVHVVLGGIHVTFCPEEAAIHADTVITGDADNVWQKFLSDFRSGKSDKIYAGGHADMKRSPPPRIELVPRNHYVRSMFGKEVYSIRASSGCPRACKFCSNWKKPGCSKIHKKTIKQIKIELERIKSYSDDFMIFFIDDNLFADVAFATKVANLVKEYNVRWVSSADVDIADHGRLLTLMRDSGCFGLCIGLESLSVNDLKWLAPWKSKYVGEYKDRIKRIKDHGLNIMGSFIYGLDHDTPDTVKEYFDFMMGNGLSAMGMGIMTPYPGTLVRERLLRQKRLDVAAPWSAYTCYNLLYKHPTMTKEEIYGALKWFAKASSTPEVTEHFIKVTYR